MKKQTIDEIRKDEREKTLKEVEKILDGIKYVDEIDDIYILSYNYLIYELDKLKDKK